MWRIQGGYSEGLGAFCFFFKQHIHVVVLVFLYSMFCCDSASEFGAMDSTSFLGFSCPNLLLLFPNLLFLGTFIVFFSEVLGLSLGLFCFILFFCTLFWVSL